MQKSKYSAAAPMLGYFYQCRLALLEFLKRLKSDPDITVAIETLDDVVFEKNGSPTEIIQVKHHTKQKANLTDASTDLWKTIRIWCDLFTAGKVHEKTILCLMTTETASNNSASWFLRAVERDILKAENLLIQISQTSSSNTNQEAYAKFNSLLPLERQGLLEKVLILDNGLLNQNLQENLTRELWGVCDRQNVGQLLDYLEGWWLKKVISELDCDMRNPITGYEIDTEIAFLREQFKSNALPIHEEIQSAIPDLTCYSNWPFVKQLRLIKIGEKRIQLATKFFYQAFEQRSRWVREDLLVDNDLNKYDSTLIEEWIIRFEQIKDSNDLNNENEDEIASGQKLYQWFESEANIPIRASCQNPFITRGSFQILSNRFEVGWHPNFKSFFESEFKEED